MRLPARAPLVPAALLAVLALGAALRLTGIGSSPPGLYPDEATNGNDALRVLETGRPQWFYPNNNGREGLFVNLQAVSLSVAGVREPWALRVVSAIAGILTIPGLYLLGRELWGKRAGLLAAAVLAGSFWHVTFSRIGFRAILAPLVLAWALGILLLGLRKLRAGQPRGAAWTVLGGALAGAGLHTYIAFRAAALAFVVAGLAATWTSRPALRARVATALLAAGAAALLVAAPLLHYFATHPGSFSSRASQVSVLADAHPLREIARNVGLEAGMLVARGDRNWRHNDAGRAALPALLVPFLVIGLGALAMQGARKRGKDLPLLLVCALLVSGMLPAVASSEGMPHALRGILLIVPVFLLAGLGLDRAWAALERIGWRWAGAALAVAVAAYGFLYTAARYPAYAARNEVRDEFTASRVELGRQLLLRDRSVPAYVVVPPGDVTIDGLPVAAQTTMFVTGTATREAQERERTFYVADPGAVPPGGAAYRMR